MRYPFRKLTSVAICLVFLTPVSATVPDGPKTDGQKADGAKTDGAKTDGAKTEKSGDDAKATTAAELQGGDGTRRPSDRNPAPEANPEPKTERQLAQERKARDAARKRGELTFDDLKFDIEKGGDFKDEMLTPGIKALDKKIVQIRGFILPTSVFQNAGIKQFVLVRDNQECCFGPGAAIYDCIIVEMAPGKSANFSTRVVAAKGKLEIDTETYLYEDGTRFAIYKMTADEVK